MPKHMIGIEQIKVHCKKWEKKEEGGGHKTDQPFYGLPYSLYCIQYVDMDRGRQKQSGLFACITN